MDVSWLLPLIPLRLTHPAFLALLVMLPLLVALAHRSRAGLGSTRHAIAVALRVVVAGLLILALAGPQRVRTVEAQTAVFLIDQSGSVLTDAQRAALAFAHTAAEGMRPGRDRVALLTFDGRAVVEQVAHHELLHDRLGAGPQPHRTNLAHALRMAMALLPADTTHRVVLLSDGNENLERAAEVANTYAAARIPIDVVPLRYAHGREMLVDRLSAPATASRGETINLNLIVRSQTATTARVLLYHNEALVALDPASSHTGFPIELEAGFNRFTIPVTVGEAGAHRFRAVLQPDRAEDDAILANNEGRAVTLVGAAQRVLILTEHDASEQRVGDASAGQIAEALRREGIESEIMEVGETVLDAGFLTGCSLVILSNVAAMSLREAEQRALSAFVRHLGGGMIVVGGDRAFSVGGYHRTPLEEVLPVETPRDKLTLLSLSMVIVIDRSGSMAGENIEMAKSAAASAVDLLSARDQIGVLAFDGVPQWIVPLQPCTDRAGIVRRIMTLAAGGGTVMYPALEQAYAALAGSTSNIKHVILLSDGHSMPGDFDGVARQLAAAGITVSSIAVGPDADRMLLARIAQLSGGRVYVTDSARPLPQIFARETILTSRSGLFEQPFAPTLRVAADEPVLRGFVPAEIPMLRGHVVMAAKPLAQLPLTRAHAEGADPIVAYWQVGLGRTVAITTGLWPQWGPDWLAWEGFSKFWAQCVRYAARPAQSTEFHLIAQVEGGVGTVVLEAQGVPPAAWGSLAVAGEVVDAQFNVRPLEVQPTGPGRFEARFAAPDPGTYIARLGYRYGSGADVTSGVLQTGLVVTYSPEYGDVTHNESLLTELARQTGGRLLDITRPESVYERWSIRPKEARVAIWEDFLRLALLLFLLDVAVRRVAVSPVGLTRRARAWLRQLAGRPAEGGAAATVATLRDVRARLRADTAAEDEVRTAPRPGLGDAAELPGGNRGNVVTDRLALEREQQSGGTSDGERAAPPGQQSPAGVSEERETMSRLLRAKRKARGEAEAEER